MFDWLITKHIFNQAAATEVHWNETNMRIRMYRIFLLFKLCVENVANDSATN